MAAPVPLLVAILPAAIAAAVIYAIATRKGSGAAPAHLPPPPPMPHPAAAAGALWNHHGYYDPMWPGRVYAYGYGYPGAWGY
jgi:hypothetical protein